MKRFHLAILALFAAVLVTTAPAHAYRDTLFDVLPFTNTGVGVTTVITDTQGVEHTYDGALDVSRLEDYAAQAVKIASYALVYEGEELLSVTLHDFEAVYQPVPPGAYAGVIRTAGELTNGYFAVGFAYNSEYEAFITGLTSETVDNVQTELVTATLTQRDFVMTNVGIDTEKLSNKHSDNTGDSDLCWAATTSNVLWYTGWAQKAASIEGNNLSFSSEDDVFDLFHKSFYDEGSQASFGIAWFLDGAYYPEVCGWPDWQGAKNPGRFLPEYAAESVMTEYAVGQYPQDIRNAFKDLYDGCGVGIGFGWFEDGQRVGGHAVTLWGYIQRKDAELLPFSKDNYAALIISDSDDNTDRTGRRYAPNTLHMVPMRPASVGNIDSWELGYNAHSVGYLDAFTSLKPYSDGIDAEPAEGYGGGTKNRPGSPDLVLQNIKINNNGSHNASVSGEVTVYCEIRNIGAGTYSGGGYRVMYIDGKEVEREAFPEGQLITGSCWKMRSDRTYTVEPRIIHTVRIELTGTSGEAYNSNNSVEWTFMVDNTPTAKLRPMLLQDKYGRLFDEDRETVIGSDWNIDREDEGWLPFRVCNEGTASETCTVYMRAYAEGVQNQDPNKKIELAKWTNQTLSPNQEEQYWIETLSSNTKRWFESQGTKTYDIWAEVYVGSERVGNLKIGTLMYVAEDAALPVYMMDTTKPSNATPFCVPMLAAAELPLDNMSFELGMLTSFDPNEDWNTMALNGNYYSYRWENYYDRHVECDFSQDFMRPGETVYYRPVLQPLDGNGNPIGAPYWGEVQNAVVPGNLHSVTSYAQRGSSEIGKDITIVRFKVPFDGEYYLDLEKLNSTEPARGEYQLSRISCWRSDSEFWWRPNRNGLVRMYKGEEIFLRFEPGVNPGEYEDGTPIDSNYALHINLAGANDVLGLGSNSEVSCWVMRSGALAVVDAVAGSDKVVATQPVFIAGYDENGKMLFVRQFNGEDIQNYPTANVKKLKFFWLNENSQPKCSAIEVHIAAPEP